MTFAFGCYADEDVVEFLQSITQRRVRKSHGFGQGEVVRAVLVDGRAEIGMVDEDLGRSDHRARDGTEVVSTTTDLQLRRQADRHLILLVPTLEDCFLRAVRVLRLGSVLPSQSRELHALLTIPNLAKHRQFRDELRVIHRESRARRLDTFLTDLEDVVRGIG